MKSWRTLTALLALTLTAAAEPPLPKSVYRATFDDGPGQEWSDLAERELEETASPDGDRTFLGLLGRQTVRLSLDKLPAHRWVRVSFDLLILRSWDGEAMDVWQLSLPGGPVLVRSTFSNCPFLEAGGGGRQCWPGLYPVADQPAQTGARSKNTLGYTFTFAASGKGEQRTDSVYRIAVSLPHTAGAMKLDFGAIQLDDSAYDEAWGLDNVVVELFDAPPAGNLTDRQIADLVDAVLKGETAAAMEALWTRSGTGPAARQAIEKRIEAQPGHWKRAGLLLRDLDDPRAVVRLRAQRHLREMAPTILPLLETAAASGASDAARVFAEGLLRDADPAARAANRGWVRLLHLRQILAAGADQTGGGPKGSPPEPAEET